MKTKNIKLEMIERILNYLDINGKLRIPANERDWPPNLYLFDEPLIPFIVKSIYFTEDVLNIDIRSNDDFYNKMNGTLSDTIRISYKDECYGLESDLKYMLSIKGLRSLESIMYTNHKDHSKKWEMPSRYSSNGH
jgi:hypothetical protein